MTIGHTEGWYKIRMHISIKNYGDQFFCKIMMMDSIKNYDDQFYKKLWCSIPLQDYNNLYLIVQKN